MAQLPKNLQLPPSYRLAAFDCLDSTNSELIRTLTQKADTEENLIVCAETQIGGRGRRNRTWVSEPGNLFFSLLKRPKRPLQEWAQTSFAVSIAIYETIRELAADKEILVECKWPNDVLVNGAKISGILLETHNIQSPDLAALIIGVGLNIKSHPDPVLYPAVSLEAVLGQPLTADQILEKSCSHLDFWIKLWETQGFISLQNEWIKRAKGIGQEITVHLEDGQITGQFDGLDEQGSLILNTAYGVRHISAGDVFFNN